jgi:hypothetical protein
MVWDSWLTERSISHGDPILPQNFSELNHLLVCKGGISSVDPFRKRAQMACRNRREEMVLGMIKHAVANRIDPPATLSAGNGRMGIAVVMYRPYGKESR